MSRSGTARANERPFLSKTKNPQKSNKTIGVLKGKQIILKVGCMSMCVVVGWMGKDLEPEMKDDMNKSLIENENKKSLYEWYDL